MRWEDESNAPPARIEMGRREFAIVAALMALLLALFPWLRVEEAREVAWKYVNFKIRYAVKGWEVPDDVYRDLCGNVDRARLRNAGFVGPKRLNRHDYRRQQREARVAEERRIARERDATSLRLARVTRVRLADGRDLIEAARLAS